MGNQPRIGVYVCHCGSNIAGTVDVGGVAELARGLDSVVVTRNYTFMCSEPGQEVIRDDIRDFGPGIILEFLEKHGFPVS